MIQPLQLSAAQLRVMASASRTQIVGALAQHGRLSAREIAAKIGRPVSGLYHHIEQLEHAGLVRAVAMRPSTRRPETVYGLISEQLSASSASRTKTGRAALAKVAKRFLSSAARSVATALASGVAVTEGRLRDTSVRHIRIRLDRKTLALFNAELDALIERVQTQSGKGKELELTVAIAPNPRSASALEDNA